MTVPGGAKSAVPIGRAEVPECGATMRHRRATARHRRATAPASVQRVEPSPHAALVVSLLWIMLGATRLARADGVVGDCGDRARAWTRECATRSALSLSPVTCLADRIVLEVALGAQGALRIDVTARGEEATVRAQGLGLSPVGSFADWGREPATRRAALDLVAACVERDHSLLARSAADAASRPIASGSSTSQGAQVGGPHDPAPDGATTPRSMTALALVLVLALALALLVLLLGAGALAVRRAAAIGSALDSVAARWSAGPLSAVALLVIVILVELWAARSADPDFFLPDPFHALVVMVAALYLVAGFVSRPQLRRALLALVFALPLLVLAMELHLASRDRSIASLRMAVSDDALLRYTYRPGATVRDRGGPMTITEDGLWDLGHTVEKPPGVSRVVVLGDSVPNDPSLAFAERFPHLLEVSLGSAPGRPGSNRVEVINVSCEGYNTIQEVRLLERVGLKYQPDLIIVAYVLNDPFLQNGAFRRVGNSYFAFLVADTLGQIAGRHACSRFAPLHAGYTFELVVRASLERLRLLVAPLRIPVLVATLPIVENFADPECLAAYDKVGAVARDQGFAFVRIVDAFRGLDPAAFLKADARGDITHPNGDGHARIAGRLAEAAAPLLWPSAPVPAR